MAQNWQTRVFVISEEEDLDGFFVTEGLAVSLAGLAFQEPLNHHILFAT